MRAQQPALLAIDASPRFETSISRRLTNRFIGYWKATHPEGQILRRDLMKTRLPFIDWSWICGAFTPAEQQSPEMKEAIRTSDELTAELLAADHIVIGTPMFNLSVPAILKAYLDHVVRVGMTVTPRYEGCLHGKRATIIVASGGKYATGSRWAAADHASTYLSHILSFLGITDTAVLLAGGTLAVDRGEISFTDFAAQWERQLSLAARVH